MPPGEFERAKAVVKERLKRSQKESADASDIDEMIDKELGILTRRNDERRKLKNYLNVSASRMIKKAEANIRAVEQGVFPLGH